MLLAAVLLSVLARNAASIPQFVMTRPLGKVRYKHVPCVRVGARACSKQPIAGNLASNRCHLVRHRRSPQLPWHHVAEAAPFSCQVVLIVCWPTRFGRLPGLVITHATIADVPVRLHLQVLLVMTCFHLMHTTDTM